MSLSWSSGSSVVSLKVGLEMNAQHAEAQKKTKATMAAAAKEPHDSPVSTGEANQEQKRSPETKAATWFSRIMSRRSQSEDPSPSCSSAGDGLESFM